MPHVPPIYSVKTRNVHHNNSACPERNNIERENIRQGTGRLPLCQRCVKFNRERK